MEVPMNESKNFNPNVEALRLLQLGNKAFRERDYNNAVTFYEDALYFGLPKQEKAVAII